MCNRGYVRDVLRYEKKILPSNQSFFHVWTKCAKIQTRTPIQGPPLTAIFLEQALSFSESQVPPVQREDTNPLQECHDHYMK